MSYAHGQPMPGIEKLRRRPGGWEPGPLLGPIAGAPVDPNSALGYVIIDRNAYRDEMRYTGVRASEFLPPNARVVRVEVQETTEDAKVIFTAPGLRHLANGELIPRYRKHYASEKEDAPSWWEEDPRPSPASGLAAYLGCTPVDSDE